MENEFFVIIRVTDLQSFHVDLGNSPVSQIFFP